MSASADERTIWFFWVYEHLGIMPIDHITTRSPTSDPWASYRIGTPIIDTPTLFVSVVGETGSALWVMGRRDTW